MEEVKIRKEVLIDLLFKNNLQLTSLTCFLRDRYYLTEEQVEIVEGKLKTFYSHFKDRWRKSSQSKTKFLDRNKKWLHEDLHVQFNVGKQHSTDSASRSRGRPRKPFAESSNRSKRRKARKIREQIGQAGVQFVHTTSLRASRKRSTADAIEKLSTASVEKVQKMSKILCEVEDKELPLSDEEALALYLDLDLSQAQYEKLRYVALLHKCHLFPPYHRIVEAKKKCYPQDTLKVTEKSASVSLQSLLDHTVSRICESKALDSTSESELVLMCKWGCDGSSGQAEYKQAFSNNEISDSSMFMISLVPIRITSNCGTLLWENPAPSSTQYCRPIKFEYAKETQDKTVTEVNSVKEEISMLTPSITSINGKVLKVNHKLFLTMVDGKVCQALTGTASASTCVICKAKPSEMNNLDKAKIRKENEDAFQYGVSSLHAWIRFMECILHLSYNLSFKKWSARTKTDKDKKENEKKRIQEEFRQRLGLIVDVPKQGSGNSNDGNTARRFFANPVETSEITKIDLNLIRRFSIILQVLACGKRIDVDKFSAYGLETATLFVSKYMWYYMPASVHKILIHGGSIIQYATLPIGQLSEEAQEARNKDYKKFREHHTRKISRLATNEELMHLLLITSDPLVTSKRCILCRKKIDLHPEACQLLLDGENDV